MFNHESPRRGETFVTRKVTRAVARIKSDLQDCLYIGNLDARRDWGHARDYVRGMWQILQQNEPSDYVLATGVSHSVRELVELAFAEIGVALEWSGLGPDEIGRDQKSGKILVRVDPFYFRPTEVDHLQGNAAKAAAQLGWAPTISFQNLIREMVESDLNEISTQKVAA